MSREEIVRRSGLELSDIAPVVQVAAVPTLSESEQMWVIGTTAARLALERAATPASDIDQVIVAGSGMWDFGFWSPAAKVGKALGVQGAHCFEVTNFCNAGLVALRTASSEIDHGMSSKSLVIVMDALTKVVNYADPASKALFNFGDGAAAMVVTKDSNRPGALELLGTKFISDPKWADSFAIAPGERHVQHQKPTPGLRAAYIENLSALCRSVLSTHNVGVHELSWFLINQGDREVHTALLESLGLPPTKSQFDYEVRGHVGGSDPFAALETLQIKESLQPGQKVAIASSAMGFSWGIGLVKVK